MRAKRGRGRWGGLRAQRSSGMHEVDVLESDPKRICRASHLWALWGCHRARAACQKERMPLCLLLDGKINVRTWGDLHSQYAERWEALERQINAHLTANSNDLPRGIRFSNWRIERTVATCNSHTRNVPSCSNFYF